MQNLGYELRYNWFDGAYGQVIPMAPYFTYGTTEATFETWLLVFAAQIATWKGETNYQVARLHKDETVIYP